MVKCIVNGLYLCEMVLLQNCGTMQVKGKYVILIRMLVRNSLTASFLVLGISG